MGAKRRALGSKLSVLPGGGLRLAPVDEEDEPIPPPAPHAPTTARSVREAGKPALARRRRKPVSPEVAKRLAARHHDKAFAEVRCVLCGHEVTMRAPSTSEVLRLLRDRCVREGWLTVLLPKGGRGSRRLMVCPRCSKGLRPVSKHLPAREAIHFDAWGS